MSTPSPSGPGGPTDTMIDQLFVTNWADPIIDRIGHDPRSAYVEHFWLGVLGPSTIWLLRHCRNELDHAADGFLLDLAETAGVLGIGHHGGRNSALARSIARACRFGAARAINGSQLEVRRRLPPLTRSQLGRLPPCAQRRHQTFVDGEQPHDHDSMQRRARRLALGLVACGEGVDASELQLGQWRFHPSIAAEAVRWAWDQHHGEPTLALHRRVRMPE